MFLRNTKNQPKIVAAFGVRYDKDLLPDLIRNLDFVDDFAILYDMGREDLWRNETEYRYELRRIADQKNADWILVTSPDERFEKNAGKKIRKIVNNLKEDKVLQFDLREMWTPDEYRVDGVWGTKTRIRMYPAHEGQSYGNYKIQNHPYPVNENGDPLYPVFDTGINIYHLKMIEPRNRKLRAEVFKKLDPGNKIQKIGYDYLYDEEGLKLQKVPSGREYHPKYKKYIFEIPEEIKKKYSIKEDSR